MFSQQGDAFPQLSKWPKFPLFPVLSEGTCARGRNATIGAKDKIKDARAPQTNAYLQEMYLLKTYGDR